MTYASTFEQPNSDTRPFVWAAVLSFLFHLLLLLFLRAGQDVTEKTIEVELIQTRPKESTIVSPSQKVSPEPPKEQARLSKSNSVVAEEQLKRGVEPEAVPSPQQKPAPEVTSPPPPSPEPKQTETEETSKGGKKAAPSVASLRLSDDKILASTAKSETKAEAESNQRIDNLLRGSSPLEKPVPESTRRQILEEYQPFKRNAEITRFSAKAGVPDYLPKIRDGDITLLNTKADRHAVFVHRVALQVFNSLRRSSWNDISGRRLNQLKGFAKVEAIMSVSGELLEVRLLASSGVPEFDKLLIKAAQEGALGPKSAKAG